MVLPIDRSDPAVLKAGTLRPLRSTPFLEGLPRLSKDGRWVAYASDEGSPGVPNIYVEAYPGPGGRWQVSPSGAFFPVWSRAKQELLFVGNDGGLMAVRYTTDGDSFQASRPEPWSPTPIMPRSMMHSYGLHPDGERVVGLALDTANMPVQRTVHLIFNLFDELRRLAPAGR